MNTQYKLSHIPDPVSDKDYSFKSVKDEFLKLSVASTDEHYIPEMTPVSDQGMLSSCAGNAACDALEMLLGIQNPSSVVQLSRLFAYWNARVYTQSTDKDQGCYLRNVMDSFSRFGVCRETTWDYNVNNVFAQPPVLAYQEAIDNKINAYYRINSSSDDRIDEVVSALKANHPVVFGTGVSNEFVNNFNAETTFGIPKTIAGNHAMIIVGYKVINNEFVFSVRNSWSSSWGKNGHFWMTSEYLTWSQTQDLWVPTLIPNLVF